MIISAKKSIRLATSNDQDKYNCTTRKTIFDEIYLTIIENYPDMKKCIAHNKTVKKRIFKILEDNSNVCDSCIDVYEIAKNRIDTMCQSS